MSSTVKIDYDHSQNLHTLEGPTTALSNLFPDGMPKSALDVGCGTGTWLRAILNRGTTDIFGVDGVEIPAEKLLFDPKCFRVCDLTSPIDLGRKFEVVFCLEVAEHLDAKFASVLVKTLTRHADKIIFSAACPGQGGQHHVNCQWPEYWQKLFNDEGFACKDSFRWKIWSINAIEPWYRQNLFLAQRDSDMAGRESRIPAVIHPKIFQIWDEEKRHAFETQCNTVVAESRPELIRQIEQGGMPLGWYLSSALSGISSKIQRRLKRNGNG